MPVDLVPSNVLGGASTGVKRSRSGEGKNNVSKGGKRRRNEDDFVPGTQFNPIVLT